MIITKFMGKVLFYPPFMKLELTDWVDYANAQNKLDKNS